MQKSKINKSTDPVFPTSKTQIHRNDIFFEYAKNINNDALL